LYGILYDHLKKYNADNAITSYYNKINVKVNAYYLSLDQNLFKIILVHKHNYYLDAAMFFSLIISIDRFHVLSKIYLE